MSRVLAESANQLYSVMVQLKQMTKKDLTKIADSLEDFFHASFLKAVEEVDETAALRVLLQLKLDPNVRYHSTHGKSTPLYIACQLGNTEAVRLLLQYQADPNIPSTEDKKTPLMVACSNKHTEVVKLLLAHKATDVEALDGDHDTALRYANDRNSTEIVRLLLESAHANPNVYGKNDWSCLLVSCCDGYLDNVVLLLEYGADPYHKVKGGKTCLMMAGQNGHIDIVRLLLDSKRVDVKRLINVQTEAGWTALALSYKTPQIVELLLEHGADPNLPTNDGWTPLILACQREGHPTTVEILLIQKYKVNKEHHTIYGLSAYSLASLNKLKVIMELLDNDNTGAKKRSRSMVGDMAMSVIMLPMQSLMRKFGSKTVSSPVTSERERIPHGDNTISGSDASTVISPTYESDITHRLVDEPKSDHICPVCKDLLTEPFLTECGHHVCGTCQDRIQAYGKSECPVCREPNALSKAQLNKHFQREVNSLRVHCQYFKEGCEWVGEVRKQHDHLDPVTGSCMYMKHGSHQATSRQAKSQTKSDLSSVTYKYQAKLAELKNENEMLQAQFDKLRASHNLIQADLDVEKELQTKLIQAVQCSRPTDFLIMQLEDKLFTQQAASPSLDASQQRRLDVLNAIKPWSATTVESKVQTSSLDVAKDFLHGVEVYGETMLEVVGDKSQKLEWPGYGFYIEVPDRALPPGVTAHVPVKVMLAGQFELPKDSQLVSAIYWVSSSEVFLKEVAVNIQHCAAITSEEQCSKFKFIVARCSQDVLPYKFKEKDGLFNMHTQYAAIKVKQFSLFGITSPWDTELHHMSLKFYRPIANTNKVDYVFALVRNYDLLVKAVRQEYADFSEDKQMQAVGFESTEVVLDLPFPDPKTEDGWKIQLLTSPKFTRAVVQQFQPSRPLVPACTIELEWIGEGQQQQLFHKVTITGAKEPNFFYMRYYPDSANTRAATSTQKVTTSSSSQRTSEVDPLTKPPKRNDLLNRVASRALNKWERMGLQLDLEQHQLDAIQSQDPIKCYSVVFDLWKKKTDPPFTWATVVEALQAPIVGENDLAEEIDKWLRK